MGSRGLFTETTNLKILNRPKLPQASPEEALGDPAHKERRFRVEDGGGFGSLRRALRSPNTLSDRNKGLIFEGEDQTQNKLAVCLALGTVREMDGILHKALEQAVKWGIVPRNICKATTPPKPSPEEIRPLDAEQAKQLLEAARWRPPSPKKALP